MDRLAHLSFRTLYDESMNQAVGRDTQGSPEHAARIAFFGGSFDPPHLGHLAIARAARDAFHLDAVLFAPVGAQPLKPEGSSANFDDRLAMTRLAINNETHFAVSLADAPKLRDAGGSQPNYTLDTLAHLRSQLDPNAELYCLMGADAFFGLRQWHRAAEIPYAASLIVASRPGLPSAGEKLAGDILDELQAALPAALALEPSSAGDRNLSGPRNSGIAVRAFSIVNPAGERAPFYLLPGLDVEISATAIREAIRHTGIRGTTVPPTHSDALQSMLPAAVADYALSHGLYR